MIVRVSSLGLLGPVQICIASSVAIVFAEAFLGQEISMPSPASGLDDPEDGLMWLVEKRRPTTIY